MTTYSNADRDTLALEGARYVTRMLHKAQARSDVATLAVPGGRSVSALFTAIARLATAPPVEDANDGPNDSLKEMPDWTRVHVFMADERFVDQDSDELNFRVVRENLLAPLAEAGLMPSDNWHPFVHDPSAPDGGVSAYNLAFDRFRETFEVHVHGFDVVILGVGEDGHCASLFPGHPSLKDESGPFIQVSHSPKPPPLRMSASVHMIAESRAAVALVLGEAKQDAYDMLRDPAVDVEQCPSKLATRCDSALLLTDL